jgi:hypothetical protein
MYTFCIFFSISNDNVYTQYNTLNKTQATVLLMCLRYTLAVILTHDRLLQMKRYWPRRQYFWNGFLKV